MPNRIFINIALFFSILYLPPIFPMVIAVFLLYYYESYYEIIFVGLFIDMLYGRSLANLHNFSYSMTLISAVLFISSIFIKKKLKFYSDR